MGKITGFLEIDRELPPDRPIEERLKDWNDVHTPFPEPLLQRQAARCMGCAVPFCHKGCPLGNLIPDWNDLVYRDHWKKALITLRSTNNFPEFTGRVCPAPCEEACVLNINNRPVTIERIEQNIAEHAYREGWIQPNPPAVRTGKRVAVVGSGPSGLACADQLNQAGHWVTVFERSDRVGGLLTYGIPDFKLEKWVVERRIDLMRAEGIEFVTSAHVGANVSVDDLRGQFEAVALALGSRQPRDLSIPGRELGGIHYAVDYLTLQNRRNQGDDILEEQFISAAGKHVVILGGGDTGSDCHGTALRQGAKSVTSFELLPKPPDYRTPNNPWPQWGRIFRTSSSHEEGGQREWSILTKRFSGENGQVKKLHTVRVEWKMDWSPASSKMVEVEGSEMEIEADLVLLALGFVGPERRLLLDPLGVELDGRGNVKTNREFMTSVPGIFACGDAHRGQSLVVWAIWEGREAARGVDQFLMGYTRLPSSPLQGP